MCEQSLPILNRLACIPSQILLVKYKNHSLQITLDTGATVSYIRRSKAIELGLKILPNDQLALLADQMHQNGISRGSRLCCLFGKRPLTDASSCDG